MSWNTMRKGRKEKVSGDNTRITLIHIVIEALLIRILQIRTQKKHTIAPRWKAEIHYE